LGSAVGLWGRRGYKAIHHRGRRGTQRTFGVPVLIADAVEVQVPADDGLAGEEGVNSGGREEGSEGQAGGGEGASAAGEGDGEDSKEAGGEGSQEQDEEGRSGTEPGGDHGEEFDVAEAEAFVMADHGIEPADEDQEEGCKRGPDRWRCQSNEQKSPEKCGLRVSRREDSYTSGQYECRRKYFEKRE